MVLLRAAQNIHFGSPSGDEWDIVIAADARVPDPGLRCLVIRAEQAVRTSRAGLASRAALTRSPLVMGARQGMQRNGLSATKSRA
jgi:hypothetical protein